MITAIIVDDEQHCIDRLAKMIELNLNQQVNLADSFMNVEDALVGIKKIKPDLIFLDIHLQDKTAFDLLCELTPISFSIIFTTAYDQYALDAFKFCAIDYLLKPIEEYHLLNAYIKMADKMSSKENSLKLEALFHNLSNSENGQKRICIPDLNGFHFVPVEDIVRCQSHINYTTIFLRNQQKMIAAKTLKEFDQLLTGKNFFRIHNSHLVNMAYIRKYQKGNGGVVTLDDGTEIEVSARRKDAFLKHAFQFGK